ncbi:CRIB domain containing protein [Melia azedarach]|uniref:CRIB domain containing protein n=1 Tax=Melia azedarach TaxID=155640 RepID=A0ACC1YSX8_MELAZ|nr:CRIB domain containing protein [Melia azedarach]
MSNNKMKGLLKGLRYISHIFENEKEPDMQIGYPTDVKHVAHIGWDGPSVNSPSWMNEFTAQPGYQSAPLNGGEKKDDSVKWVSEDSSSRRSGRDLPELPKSSRRHASTGESPIRERSEKKQSRRSSKNSNKDLSESTKSKDASQGGESPPKRPDMPKKSRRKKSKESADGSSRSSTRSRRAHHASKSDSMSECGSISGSVSGSVSKANNEQLILASGLNPSEGGAEKEFTGIS